MNLRKYLSPQELTQLTRRDFLATSATGLGTLALASLLKQLRLPDEADSAEARSTKARAAANARWSKRAC